MPWFPLLLAVHVLLALALLLPSVLLPFLLRERGPGEHLLGEPAAPREPGEAGDGARLPRIARLLAAVQGTGSLVIGLGLATTGGGLLVVLGPDLLTRPWLLAALAVYAANLAVAGLVSRPNLRRLVARDPGVRDAAWGRGAARRQRWIAYAMAAATGLIGFLMSAKPEL